MGENKVRVTFSCDSDLKERLTKRADNQGIPRSQLIVELLDHAMGIEDKGKTRTPEVNRFMFDIQQRLADLETWRREIQEWTVLSDENTDNLETTIANMLNEKLTDLNIKEDKTKKKSIPSPKK